MRRSSSAVEQPRGTNQEANPTITHRSGLLLLLAVLLVVLGFMFRDSFRPDMALFANDSPLGAVSASFSEMPAGWTGVWVDLNWLGLNGHSMYPDLTAVLFWMLGPLKFINFYPAITLVVLGFAAWLLFRQLGFHPVVCILGGIAAALNSDYFSYACWGLGTLPLCVASVFLAMAALVTPTRPFWAGPVLAGVALGSALMEGFDNGAIFSLYVAAFALFHAWNTDSVRSPLRRISGGIGRTAAIAITSGIVAIHVLLGLIQLNISGVAGAGESDEDRAARWTFATQWSLPPREALRAVIPGLFGYRMDTPGGGHYWGKVGDHPVWDEYWASPSRDPSNAPLAPMRHSGAGHYTGVLVVLGACFAVAQGFRRRNPVFTDVERRWVWFWAIVALLSFLFALGRFAPFYQIIFALPYFSSIRIPMKFLHPFNVALIVLFAYGMQALWRGSIERAVSRPGGFSESLKAWWSTAPIWERRWTFASIGMFGVAALGWLIYGSSRSSVIQYLLEIGALQQRIGEPAITMTEAEQIFRFSHKEVGLFVFVLAVSVLLLIIGLSGAWSGRKARVAALCLGLVLTIDLARANLPWIVHYNWKERYATNALFDLLRARPYEGRVTGQLPFDYSRLPTDVARLLQALGGVYGGEWLQHQFRYWDIQSLDVVQMPREPADRAAYRTALRGKPLREWELSNTRYLLTLAPLVEPMNQQLDPEHRRFRVHTPFTLSQSEDRVIHVQTNTAGPFALVEFTGALPRAILFDRWRSNVPDEEALQILGSSDFDPHTEVLVAEAIPAPAVATSTQPAGTATYTSYSPRRFTIATESRTPCVLLVNDKHDPGWRVYVDGRQEPLLRANFITRGVYLSPGNHEVEFRFEPPLTTMWISSGAILAGLLLCGFTIWRGGTSKRSLKDAGSPAAPAAAAA